MKSTIKAYGQYRKNLLHETQNPLDTFTTVVHKHMNCCHGTIDTS